MVKRVEGIGKNKLKPKKSRGNLSGFAGFSSKKEEVKFNLIGLKFDLYKAQLVQ